jgi:hypothetical protein
MAIMNTTRESVSVTIITNNTGNPAGKLADAEPHVIGGPLTGIKLIGSGSGSPAAVPAGGASGASATTLD